MLVPEDIFNYQNFQKNYPLNCHSTIGSVCLHSDSAIGSGPFWPKIWEPSGFDLSLFRSGVTETAGNLQIWPVPLSVFTQIWTALIAILLVKWLQFRSKSNGHCQSSLRWNLFTYKNLWLHNPSLMPCETLKYLSSPSSFGRGNARRTEAARTLNAEL